MDDELLDFSTFVDNVPLDELSVLPDQEDSAISVLSDTDYTPLLQDIRDNLNVLNVTVIVMAAIIFLVVMVNAIKKALCLDLL